MKLHLFIWLIAVLGFVRGHGAPAGAMTLQPERLEAVVAQLEAVYENAGQQLPTLVYSAGVRDLSVEAPLRLGEVRAVDALTLIAAAAGCELEPIHSLEPEEESEGIIGYRFVHAQPQGGVGGGGFGGIGGGLGGGLREGIENGVHEIGVALEARDGGIYISQILPGTMAEKSGFLKVGDRVLVVGEEGVNTILAKNLALQDVVNLLRGPVGTAVELTVATESEAGAKPRVVKLVRERLPNLAEKGSAPLVKVVEPILAPGQAEAKLAREEANRRVVRIHALGSLLSGPEEEAREKQDALGKLVAEAMALSDEADFPNPDLSIHRTSGALIVKATERQHEVVEQALAALKEHKESTSSLKR